MALHNWTELEAQLDVHSKARTLNSNEAKQLLDIYYTGLIESLNLLNFDEHRTDLLPMDSYDKYPLNFFERIQYIESRKYHFMGYQQMKTMKSELIKMLAVKSIKKNNIK